MIIDQMLLISINRKYLTIGVAKSALFKFKQWAQIEFIDTGNSIPLLILATSAQRTLGEVPDHINYIYSDSPSQISLDIYLDNLVV